MAEEDRSTEILVNDNDGANKVMKPNGEMEVEIECLHSSNWSANPTCYLVQVGFLPITFFSFVYQCEKLDWSPSNVMEKVNLNLRGDLRGQGTIRTFGCKTTKSSGG